MSLPKGIKLLGLDFDGTCVENAYPAIGEPKWEIIDYVMQHVENGWQIILITNREGKELKEAVEWCRKRKIPLVAVNDNHPAIIKAFGGNTRKIFAHKYLDDRNITLDQAIKGVI